MPILWLVVGCTEPEPPPSPPRDRPLRLREVPVGAADSPTMAVTAVDLDDDGVLEAVMAKGKHWRAINTIHRSVAGWLDVEEPLSVEEDRSFNIAAGDLDGDGLVDLVVANETPTPNRVCRQAVDGSFSCVALPDLESRDVDLVDLDGDDDLDVVFADKRQLDWLMLNDGAGGFTYRGGLGPETRQSVVAAAADLDRDGLVDIVVGARGDQPSAIHRGTPRGHEPEGLALDAFQTRALAVVDLDGDGDLDLVMGNIREPNTILYNDEQLLERGGPAVVFCPEPLETWAIDVVDIDGDGWIDIVEGNVHGPDEIHLGRPDGTFGDPLRFGPSDGDTRDIAVADFDGDGDPDLLLGRWEDQDALYFAQ